MYVKNEAKGREGRGRGRPHAEIHVAGRLLVVCITLQIKPNETCLQAMITRNMPTYSSLASIADSANIR